MDEPDCLLLVEDEPDVRSSFRIWLERLDPRPRILEAESARAALELANQNSIDLVILDWNLGAGINGLELLISLKEFHPDIVSILVTGYADLATPLKALRLGVRDYLDKHAGLDESTFLGAVQAQLDQLRPRKREKRVQLELKAFRESVSQALPWLRHASDLKPRPVTNEASLGSLLRLLTEAFAADCATLVTWSEESEPAWRAIDSQSGAWASIAPPTIDGTLAHQCLVVGEPVHLADFRRAIQSGEIRQSPWEKAQDPIAAVAIPLRSNPGGSAVLCLYSSGNREKQCCFPGQTEKLAPIVEAALASYPIHPTPAASASQWRVALEDALKRAQQIGDSLENQSPQTGPGETPNLVATVRADLEKCWQESLPPGAGEAATRLLGAAVELAREFGAPALDHARNLVDQTGRFLRDLESGR